MKIKELEENKLIVEFMGWDIQSPTTIPTNLHLSNLELDNGEVMELKFNKSWDWLMPVVNKIEDYLADNVGKVGYFDDCLSSNDLEVRHQAVVEFIKQYNNC